MKLQNQYVGTCTMCGAKNQKLLVVDEETHVCPFCLDANFFFCDECQEFWECGVIDEVELEDGRIVCEYCAKDIAEEEFEYGE